MNGHQQPACSRKQLTSSVNSATDPPMLRPDEEEMERQSLEKIITAFRYYGKYSYARVNKSESYIDSMQKHHQHMLSEYRKHLTQIRDCIDENQAVIQKMTADHENIFDRYPVENIITQKDVEGHATKIMHRDMENVQSTLKQLARDWSAECAEEREQSYKPIIDVIEEFFNPEGMELNAVKILVPGAGLGRLSYELSCRGYECEGNEYSYFMMIASNFVLNQCTEENQCTIFPWVHQYVNNVSQADQVAPIRFPDVCPLKNKPKGNITMSAGDFLEVYKIPNSYDCVATCFFIDCANNVIEFIETIYSILVPGGIWVNLGPLLYHFSDIRGENSIEPSYQDLMKIIKAVGFEVIRSETGRRTKYAQNPRSILQSEYRSLFWICKKPSILLDMKEHEVNGSGDTGDNSYRNGHDIEMNNL